MGSNLGKNAGATAAAHAREAAEEMARAAERMTNTSVEGASNIAHSVTARTSEAAERSTRQLGRSLETATRYASQSAEVSSKHIAVSMAKAAREIRGGTEALADALPRTAATLSQNLHLQEALRGFGDSLGGAGRGIVQEVAVQFGTLLDAEPLQRFQKIVDSNLRAAVHCLESGAVAIHDFNAVMRHAQEVANDEILALVDGRDEGTLALVRDRMELAFKERAHQCLEYADQHKGQVLVLSMGVSILLGGHQTAMLGLATAALVMAWFMALHFADKDGLSIARVLFSSNLALLTALAFLWGHTIFCRPPEGVGYKKSMGSCLIVLQTFCGITVLPRLAELVYAPVSAPPVYEFVLFAGMLMVALQSCWLHLERSRRMCDALDSLLSCFGYCTKLRHLSANLFKAAQAGDDVLCVACLQGNADPNAQEYDTNMTALMLVVTHASQERFQRYFEAARALLDYGASTSMLYGNVQDSLANNRGLTMEMREDMLSLLKYGPQVTAASLSQQDKAVLKKAEEESLKVTPEEPDWATTLLSADELERMDDASRAAALRAEEEALRKEIEEAHATRLAD